MTTYIIHEIVKKNNINVISVDDVDNLPYHQPINKLKMCNLIGNKKITTICYDIKITTKFVIKIHIRT